MSLQTFKPRPREAKPKDKEKDRAEHDKAAPAPASDPPVDLDLEKPPPERKELQAEPTAPRDLLDAPANPVPTPSPTVKASPAITADALPTLDLSNPDDVASLTLSPVPGEEWIEPGVVVEKLAALLKVGSTRRGDSDRHCLSLHSRSSFRAVPHPPPSVFSAADVPDLH